MADIDRERIQQLVNSPGESLVVEIKTWFLPSQPAGQAKIIKAAIALRNRGGGYLVIGFDDRTLQQDRDAAPEDIRQLFHADVIQALVAKYASQPFEIAVEYVEREGIEHPVIVIPPGVRTPIAAKADLKDGNDFLIRTDDIYFRTLNSGNVVSSSKVKWKDWVDLVEICFDNREADIGRFFRRHLSGVNSTALQTFAAAIGVGVSAQHSVSEKLEKILEEGKSRFETVVKERQLNLPPHGSWEVALMIEGEFPSQTNLEGFASLLSASNPSYTGWPVWLSSRQFADQESRPNVQDRAWETLLVRLNPSNFRHIDFMRQDPRGRFYSYRALDDDVTSVDNGPTPMTTLEGILSVLRTCEAIAVGQAFAKAMQASDKTQLQFMFRWNGLKGRVLDSWANPGRYVTPRRTNQDLVTSSVTVPIDTPPSALAEYVKTALRPLFEIFEGFEFPGSVIDEITQKFLERQRI